MEPSGITGRAVVEGGPRSKLAQLYRQSLVNFTRAQGVLSADRYPHSQRVKNRAAKPGGAKVNRRDRHEDSSSASSSIENAAAKGSAESGMPHIR